MENAALTGDTEASYLLALNFRYCYSTPIDEDALDKKLAEAAEFSDTGRATDHILNRFSFCKGIGLNKRRDFYSYLRSAALDGFVPAQEYLGRITPKDYMKVNGFNNLEREEFIQQRDKFVKLKIDLLEHAGKQGSVKALAQLSNMYDSQNHGANGLVKSFALNNLILEITTSNEFHSRFTWLVQRQHEQLSAEEIQSGLDMADQWLQAINNNGTLYPFD